MSTYLGIDVGTSGVKAMLIDDGGQAARRGVGCCGRAGPAATRLVRAEPRRLVERDALRDRQARGAHHQAELAAVKGIGLSGHMHGATLLGKNDEVLRPAILWNDGRSHVECGEMERALPSLRQLAGNIAMPGFTAPKIAWVRKHEPEIYDKIDKVLLPKAYVRLLLTGEAIEDMSDASGTLWLDVAKRDWSDELLALTGFTRANMPKLAEGTDPAGHLKDDLKARWGMTGTVVVAGSAGDNAAAACGIGAIRPGEGFVSLGTSGRAVRLERQVPAQHRGRGPRLLPLDPRHLAPDGRDPLAPPTASTGWRMSPARSRPSSRARPKRSSRDRARRSSSPTSRASARRTTMPMPAARSSASRISAVPSVSRRR